MQATEDAEREAVAQLTALLHAQRVALQDGRPWSPAEQAEQLTLQERLLALRAAAGERVPGAELAAAVLQLQEALARLEHVLRVRMGEVRTYLEPVSKSSADSFGQCIGRGQSLGSA